MIYERPGERARQADRASDVNSVPSGSIVCYDISSIPTFAPIKINSRKINKKLRRARRRTRAKKTLKKLFAFVFVVAGAVVLLYPGVYQNHIAPVQQFLSKVSQSLYAPVQNSEGVSYEYINKGTLPSYLTRPTTVFVSADEGDDISAIQSQVSDIPDDKATPVSNQDGGKTGSDGLVFYPLIEKDLSSKSPYLLTNQTNYSVDTQDILDKRVPALSNLVQSENPLVLIVHTHATECYSQSEHDSYNSQEPTRSDDTSQNVVRIGSQVAKTLEDFGIGVIHDQTLHDKASFINAYSHSYSAVKQYLEEYPSIKFVLDIHRDAITDGQGGKTKPVTIIAGEKYAQIMFVVGTDQSKKSHSGWKDNLSLAFALENKLHKTYPSLCRKTNLRSVSFNQELSNGYLLVEIGSHGNNLSEALRSADAFAVALSGLITDNLQM